MKYKLRNNYSKDPTEALYDILKDRGVTDIQAFCNPTKEQCELNPYDLENIRPAADMLLRHLRRGSRILFVVDCDADGFTSSSILWLYIKSVYPDAQLIFTVHEGKAHGLEDKIEWIEDAPNYDLVICPDAASYNVEEHLRLGELGIDCLVLDHHAQEYDDDGNPIISTSPNTVVVNN